MKYEDIKPCHINQLSADGILVSERGDDGSHEIQACDELGLFKDDPAAWHFFRVKAQLGYPAYVEILKFIESDNPAEYDRIIHSQVSN